jgi:hypothetical protein
MMAVHALRLSAQLKWQKLAAYSWPTAKRRWVILRRLVVRDLPEHVDDLRDVAHAHLVAQQR